MVPFSSISGARTQVLHIGGSATGAVLVRESLAGDTGRRFDVAWVDKLSDALEELTARSIDAILLDFTLPDISGMAALEWLIRVFPAIPVLVIGAHDDEATARIALAGAIDCLEATRLDSYWLPRALDYGLERTVSAQALRIETERVEVTLDSIGYALISIDLSGRITFLSRIAEAMTGWSRAEAAGRPLEDVLQIVDDDTRGPADNPMTRTDAGNVDLNCTLIRRDGSECGIEQSSAPIRDRLGQRLGTTIAFRDISAARAVSARMSHLASHDPLTDLPNRLLLTDRLARALALAHRHNRRLAVLFLDIDRFKYINDSLGHLLGDELLRSVAREVTMCVRSSDTVSRHGGDEFVIVLSELERVEDAALGAQKIISALARPHRLAGHEIHITVSIGISVYPDDGQEGLGLLESADVALYHAKDQGRDCYQFFKTALNARALERQSIEAGLHTALDKMEFELFYQPKINLKSGAVVGAEALIRWHHPVRGLLHPALFVPIAEDCGLIRSIGRWVVHEACRQARAWQDAGFAPITMAVNISAVEFRSKGFLEKIVEILQETRLEPRYLEIELTETALMTDVAATTTALHALKTLGVQLAIDDFGTGWSSLSYLRAFPIDALKVDKSFVQEITGDSRPAPIVSAVINMGKSLRRRVVAEGVETPEQLAFLKGENCEEGQGFFFSVPLTATDFVRLLQPLNQVLAEPVRRLQRSRRDPGETS